MVDAWKEIYKIINGSNVSIKRSKNNETIVLDAHTFKGLPQTKVDLITQLTDAWIKERFQMKGIAFRSLDDIIRQAQQAILQTAQILAKRPVRAEVIRDSFFNEVTTIGTNVDQSTYSTVAPNVWISPWEAAALYSQKGLAEIVVNKKAKAILLNGVKIKNKMLTAKQIDKISLNMIRRNIPKILADAVRDSLVYGGALVFPIFKKDNPVTLQLSVEALLKQGIIGQNCIDYVISLDRWNTVHIPATNPTSKDFLLPVKYFIPFLGADVHGTRCSRIVTSQQAGYFGAVMTLGWGLSDYVGYARSMTNYKLAAQTLPIMIQQMSIVARTIDVEGILANEGANALDALQEQNTIRIREISANNPVTLDILGDLKVINRDFSDVDELIKLLRQDFAADTGLPEPMLFSSERGSFSSGDDTQGNLIKQYESVKYIHKDVETQFKNLAKLLVIDTLGTDREILEALPYTEIHFDVPLVANSTERAQIGLNLAKGFFEFVSGQMPLADAAKIVSAYGGDEMSLDSELLASLEERQREADERNRLKYEKELELLEAQIDAVRAGVAAKSSSTPNEVSMKATKENSKYSRLEQKMHEKTRMPGEKRMEKLTKARNLAETNEKRQDKLNKKSEENLV